MINIYTVLNASQTAMLLGCGPSRVAQRIKRGYWNIGIAVPPKSKNGNCTYEVIPQKLSEQFGVSLEEIFRALEEKRPLRIFEKEGVK